MVGFLRVFHTEDYMIPSRSRGWWSQLRCFSGGMGGWSSKVSCEPTSQKDADKLGEALNKLAAEDPSFRYSRDEESNQTVIEGMGELHLEIIIDRLKREFKVEAEVGKPQVGSESKWSSHKKLKQVGIVSDPKAALSPISPFWVQRGSLPFCWHRWPTARRLQSQ